MELNSGLGHYAIYKIGFCEKIILPFAEWNYIISSFKKIALQVSVKFDFWNPVNNQVLLIFFFFLRKMHIKIYLKKISYTSNL